MKEKLGTRQTKNHRHRQTDGYGKGEYAKKEDKATVGEGRRGKGVKRQRGQRGKEM